MFARMGTRVISLCLFLLLSTTLRPMDVQPQNSTYEKLLAVIKVHIEAQKTRNLLFHTSDTAYFWQQRLWYASVTLNMVGWYVLARTTIQGIRNPELIPVLIPIDVCNLGIMVTALGCYGASKRLARLRNEAAEKAVESDALKNIWGQYRNAVAAVQIDQIYDEHHKGLLACLSQDYEALRKKLYCAPVDDTYTVDFRPVLQRTFGDNFPCITTQVQKEYQGLKKVVMGSGHV